MISTTLDHLRLRLVKDVELALGAILDGGGKISSNKALSCAPGMGIDLKESPCRELVTASEVKESVGP
ncbi:hypothetical protein [Bradyrhizobium japonicum]|uniref:hypothetical protein n=1 Tax=Bradyrhizobium japonicum TaxID=375 RepID=UPI003B6776EE